MKKFTSRLQRTLFSKQDQIQILVQTHGLHRLARMSCWLLGEGLHQEHGEMTQWQIEVLKALQEGLCDYAEFSLPHPSECNAHEESLTFLSWMSADNRQMLAELLSVLEASPRLLRMKGASRFTDLDHASRQKLLEAWGAAQFPPLRASFHALKSVCMMGYWTRPQTWPFIGYSIADNPGVPARLKKHHKNLETTVL